VNGDNMVSPLDVLLVINQIGNSVAAAPLAAPLSGRAEVGATVADAARPVALAGNHDGASVFQRSNHSTALETTDSLSANHNERASQLKRTLIGPDGIARGASIGDAPMDDLEGILVDVAADVLEAWRGT